MVSNTERNSFKHSWIGIPSRPNMIAMRLHILVLAVSLDVMMSISDQSYIPSSRSSCYVIKILARIVVHGRRTCVDRRSQRF